MDRTAYRVVDKSSGAQELRVWEPWVTGGKGDQHSSYKSTGQLVVTSRQEDVWFLAVRPVAPEAVHGDALLDILPKAKEILLNPREMDTKTRRGPGVQRGGPGTYTIPHGDVSFLGQPAKFKKVLIDLVRSGLVGADFAIMAAPEWRGKTVGDVLGIARKDLHDPVEEIARGSLGAVIMYHGTSAKRWETIKSQGLRPGKTPAVYGDLVPGYSDRLIYLTTSVGEAENYATRAAVDDQAKAVVLQLEVNDFSKLRLDEDTAGWVAYKDMEYHFSGENWKKSPDAAEIMSLFQAKILAGLRGHKTVAYKGMIPANRIKVLLTYKPRAMKKDPEDAQFLDAMNKTRDTLKWNPVKVAQAQRVALRHLEAHYFLSSTGS